MIGVSMPPWAMALDGGIGRGEGPLLTSLMVGYTVLSHGIGA